MAFLIPSRPPAALLVLVLPFLGQPIVRRVLSMPAIGWHHTAERIIGITVAIIGSRVA